MCSCVHKKKSKEVFLETETEHGNNGTNITGVLFFHYVESKKAINVFFSINWSIFSVLPAGLIPSSSCQQHLVFPGIGSLRAKSHVCCNKSLSGKGSESWSNLCWECLRCMGLWLSSWVFTSSKDNQTENSAGYGFVKVCVCVCVWGGIAPFCVQTYQFHFYKKHPHRICTCMYILYILIILILLCKFCILFWMGWGWGGYWEWNELQAHQFHMEILLSYDGKTVGMENCVRTSAVTEQRTTASAECGKKSFSIN